MEIEEAIAVLQQRALYLDARVEAKQKVGWEYQWDARERDALRVLLAQAARGIHAGCCDWCRQ